jgi:4-hydroxy-2-oxoheptanedioate aldolase
MTTTSRRIDVPRGLMTDGSHISTRPNRLRDVWARGGVTLGAIVTSPSVSVIQVMARSGLDWILIDMEHGAIDGGALHAMIAATSGTPLVPLVRVPGSAAWHAKVPLDLGAMGICFPMTTRRLDAESAVKAVRYPPLGDRHWGPFYAPLRWNLGLREYADRADEEVLAIGTIEHVDALGSIAEVVATPGLDLAIIGAGDLATSMGLKGNRDHPSVQQTIEQLEAAILKSPVVLGGVASTAERANEMIARGYRAIVVGFDWSLLQTGIASVLDGIRKSAKT